MTETFTFEDAIKIARAINITRKYDEMLMKSAQFKEAVAKRVVSPFLKKLEQEGMAAKNLSKGWVKREGEIAGESGLKKLSEAIGNNQHAQPSANSTSDLFPRLEAAIKKSKQKKDAPVGDPGESVPNNGLKKLSQAIGKK